MMQVSSGLKVGSICMLMIVQTAWLPSGLAAGLLTSPVQAGQSEQPAALLDSGLASDQILPVDQAFRFGSYFTNQGVQIFWQVQPGYYLYRDKISVVADGQKIVPQLPAGQWREDEIFGEVLVLEGLVETLLPRDEGDFTSIQVQFQGCAAKGFCYPPQKIEITSSKLGPTSPNL